MVSESTLNYLLVYAARCNANREVGLLINSKASKTLAVYDTLKGITEPWDGYLAWIWLPQVILGKLLDLHLHWDISKYSLISRSGFAPQLHTRKRFVRQRLLTFILVMSKMAGCEGWKEALACWSTGALGVWDRVAQHFHFNAQIKF